MVDFCDLGQDTFTLGRSDYQRQYQPILYGWKDRTDYYWCGARDQATSGSSNKPYKNDLHPTMKPALVERAIRNSSKSRDIVLDLFSGLGTTMIAAEHGIAAHGSSNLIRNTSTSSSSAGRNTPDKALGWKTFGEMASKKSRSRIQMTPGKIRTRGHSFTGQFQGG